MTPTAPTCAACCGDPDRVGDVLLQAEAAGLAGLTVVLAGPVTSGLARAHWPARSPRAALVLWQAVGLAGGLGILTAGLTLAAASVDPHWLSGLVAVPYHWPQLGPGGWLGVGLTACVGVWLVTATIASAVRVLHARRLHRRRLDLITGALRVGPADAGHGSLQVRLIEHPEAVAYCLPGLRPQVVLSSGALAALDEGELAAVLAHERAHARGRHDLVIQPFIAWARTFPFLATARHAVTAVSLLVEMLADDTALHDCQRQQLRSALRRLTGVHHPVSPPSGAVADVTRQVAVRTTRLDASTRPLPRATTVLIYITALALVLVPPITLLCS